MADIYFVYDVGPQSERQWLASSFKGQDVHWVAMKYNPKNRIHKWRKPFHFLGYIEVAVRVIRKSKPGDSIVSWNFIIGAFIGVICHLLGLKRTVLSLNMISHSKKGLVANARRVVYNYAFSYKGFLFTANSFDTIERYSKDYKFDRSIAFVLPDAYLDSYEQADFYPISSYIFCGGEAQRDWALLFEGAKLLPEYKFVGVGRRKYMEKGLEIPDNVKMYYDIGEDKFDELLKNASIVALPLKSDMPAGLIVMFKAILLSKPVITTKSSSMENYLQNGENGVLLQIGDMQGLVKNIKALYSNSDLGRMFTQKAKESIQRYSPSAYSQTIYRILNNNRNENTFSE